MATSGPPYVQIVYDNQPFGDPVNNQQGAVTDFLTVNTPCPLVSIDTSTTQDVDDNILLATTTITLEGIIIGTGINHITQGWSGVYNYFSDPKKQNSLFEIECGSKNGDRFTQGGPILAYSGTRLVSANAAKSNDNWALTLPYTIVLESVVSPSGDFIESYEDNWTFEQLEDVSYYSVGRRGVSMYDYKGGVPNDELGNNNSPGRNYPPSSQQLSLKAKDVFFDNSLRYRITHRVSAVGKPSTHVNPNNPGSGGSANTNNVKFTAYENAAIWVMKRVSGSTTLDSASSSTRTKPTGVVLSHKTPVALTAMNSLGLFLYNHVRSIESSPGAGSYTITDTWLAMGTGVTYTEDLNWDVSVDNKWVQTVTLNGTINGLETASFQAKDPYAMFSGIPKNTSLPGGVSRTLFEPAATGLIKGGAGLSNASVLIENKPNTMHKYTNALGAYISGIKPYLYQRANYALSAVQNPHPDVKSQASTRYPQFDNPVQNQGLFGPRYRPLNITPITFTESFNPNAGSITYNVSYDNRPSCLLSGALDASLTIVDTNQVDQIAEAFVLGRPLGPVIEKVGNTRQERKITIEALYPQPTGFSQLHPNSPNCVVYSGSIEHKCVNDLIEAFKPVGASAFRSLQGAAVSPYPVSVKGQVFRTADSQTWNPFEGRLTRDITWVYNTGNCIEEIDVDNLL